MNIQLENKNFSISINTKGAELNSFKNQILNKFSTRIRARHSSLSGDRVYRPPPVFKDTSALPRVTDQRRFRLLYETWRAINRVFATDGRTQCDCDQRFERHRQHCRR